MRIDERDPNKVNRKKMAWRIRRLLEALDVPIDVPPELAELRSWRKGDDGPRVITELRHSIIHPTSLDHVFDLPGSLKLDVLNLAMWYADLALLHLLDYQGDHLRRAQPLPIFEGRGEPVPWAARHVQP